MTVLEMYDRVLLVTPLDERRFFNFLNDTVSELSGAYGDVPKLLYSEDGACLVDSLEGDTGVLGLYHHAMVDNILFLAGAGEHYKSEFLRKAQAAHVKYWNKNAKGRRMKRYV